MLKVFCINELLKLNNFANFIKIANTNNIKYALTSGSLVSLLTGYRKPTDGDFILDRTQTKKFLELFPRSIITYDKENFEGASIFPFAHKDIEVVEGGEVYSVGRSYNFEFTKLSQEHALKAQLGELEITILNPADLILFKAILFRGKEKYKRDREDILQIMKNVKIDCDYLARRFAEIGGDNIISNRLENIVCEDIKI